MDKCHISSTEKDCKVSLEAAFNPTEITIKKRVPWTKHDSSKADSPVLEFTNADPRELSVDLLFDTYESGKNVYQECISKLENLTKVRQPGAQLEELLRPPHATLTWSGFPRFKGVVISLSVKYTMFFRDGTPCRATASVVMQEAAELRYQGSSSSPGESDGGTVQAGMERTIGRDVLGANDVSYEDLIPGMPLKGLIPGT